MKPLLSLLACLLLTTPCLHAQGEMKTVYFNGSDFKEGYYVVPSTPLPAGEKYWVVVSVHGAGGLKKEISTKLINLLAPTPVILLVPSFSNMYQMGDGKWADQMIDNFKEVGESYPTHDKMFVHGFSGGAQFAHRFTFNEPKYVVGCSAHGAGSWACDGGYGKISTSAKGLPFFISC